ncbi:MAG: hypothetical protein M1820_004582 [Bogoriella megaspora]|nr:MAG: hypothetical protein M1820_004582 [Bogoriella megaspora]
MRPHRTIRAPKRFSDSVTDSPTIDQSLLDQQSETDNFSSPSLLSPLDNTRSLRSSLRSLDENMMKRNLREGQPSHEAPAPKKRMLPMPFPSLDISGNWGPLAEANKDAANQPSRAEAATACMVAPEAVTAEESSSLTSSAAPMLPPEEHSLSPRDQPSLANFPRLPTGLIEISKMIESPATAGLSAETRLPTKVPKPPVPLSGTANLPAISGAQPEKAQTAGAPKSSTVPSAQVSGLPRAPIPPWMLERAASSRGTISPLSHKRSGFATKHSKPIEQKPHTDTVRRRQPPSNPKVDRVIPEFAKTDKPCLEEVIKSFGADAPSFLNQAVNVKGHGIGKLLDAWGSERSCGPIAADPLVYAMIRGKSDEMQGKKRRQPGHKHWTDKRDTLDSLNRPGGNGLDPTKPVKLGGKGVSSKYKVDPENGPFYDTVWIDEDTLAMMDSSDEKNGTSMIKPPKRVNLNGTPMKMKFSELAAQVAVDVYCQIYFEAAAVSDLSRGKNACRILLDLDAENDKKMDLVLAARLLDKKYCVEAPFDTSKDEGVREVHPEASPLVGSFSVQNMKRLGGKRVDWNYAPAAEVGKARNFFIQHKLPPSLLRDWTETEAQPPPQPGPSVPQLRGSFSTSATVPQAAQKVAIQNAPVSKPPVQGADVQGFANNLSSETEPQGNNTRKRKAQSDSGSEYEESSDESVTEMPPPKVQKTTYQPPRPSFAKPGVSVAHQRLAGGAASGLVEKKKGCEKKGVETKKGDEKRGQ